MTYPVIPDIVVRASQVIDRIDSIAFYSDEDMLFTQFADAGDLPERTETYGSVIFLGENVKGRNPQRDPQGPIQDVDSHYRLYLFARRNSNDYGQAAAVSLQRAIPQIYKAYSGWTPRVEDGTQSCFCPGVVESISKCYSNTKLVWIVADIVFPYITGGDVLPSDDIYLGDRVAPWYIDSNTGRVVFNVGPLPSES